MIAKCLVYFRFAGVVIGLLILLGACDAAIESPDGANRPPEIGGDIVLEPAAVETGQTATVTIASVADPDQDSLVYVWRADRGTIENPEAVAAQYKAPETSGPDTLTVVVSDRKGGSASKSLRFDVVPRQAPPETPSIATPTKAPNIGTLTLETSVEPAEAGSILIAPSPSQDGGYLPRTNLVAIATPNEGFQFTAWAGDAGGSENPLAITMTTDFTLVAVFSATPIAVPVTLVEILPDSARIAFQAEIQLKAVLKDATGNVVPGRVVKWTSDNRNVAIVSERGLVEGVGIGTAVIKAAVREKTGTAKVEVVGIVGGDFVINIGGPPFRDPRVIEAFLVAVPWFELASNLFGDQDTAIVLKLDDEIITGDARAAYYDPTIAKKLLFEAGHSFGFKMVWPAVDTRERKFILQIGKHLSAVGVLLTDELMIADLATFTAIKQTNEIAWLELSVE